MARRNQGINVKVPRAKVIKALETKLVELNKSWATQSENETKYENARAKWRKDVGKFDIANVAKAENFRTNYRSWNKTLNVDFDLICNENEFPAEPQREYKVLLEHSYTEMKEEIENALRILKMCDDELISTATYGGITKYL
jgi:vacuolar-type H+-ATPase subunit I/STV1